MKRLLGALLCASFGSFIMFLILLIMEAIKNLFIIILGWL